MTVAAAGQAGKQLQAALLPVAVSGSDKVLILRSVVCCALHLKLQNWRLPVGPLVVWGDVVDTPAADCMCVCVWAL